jgi:hypothetical protein
MSAPEQGQEYMRIVGKWHKCDDGIVRPMLVIDAISAAGVVVEEMFLVDSGADRTVFSAALLGNLGGGNAAAPVGVSLEGVGGIQPYVEIQAKLSLRRLDGGVATVQANFAAFTDPKATDFSILGRDVLDHFDLIVSRRRDEVTLLGPPSRYDIQP